MLRLRGIMSNLRDWSGNVKPKRFCVLRSCFGGGRSIVVCLTRSGILRHAPLPAALICRSASRPLIAMYIVFKNATRGGGDMDRFRDQWKTWVAAIGLTLLTSAAWADPQSEISVYRKSYGLSAVTADAKLTELARQQANAMAERHSMDHNVYASFHSRIKPYGSPAAAENIAMETKTFEETRVGTP